MKFILINLAAIIIFGVSCQQSKTQVQNQNDSLPPPPTLTKSEIVSHSPFNSGYVYLEFRDDFSIWVYQKTSKEVSAWGCTADGMWQILDGKVDVTIIKSYCGSNSYSELNGLYTYSDGCLDGPGGFFCKWHK